MNALKYTDCESVSQKTTRNDKSKSSSIKMNRNTQRHQKQRLNSHIEQALEITFKITINGLLIFVAFSALNKLLPYHQSQQEKLAEINVEVEETQKRVNQLRERFNRNFDPSQSKKVMEKNTHKVDPNQRPVFFH